MKKQTYVVPEVEVLEIKLEKGFAQSGEGGFNVPNGENFGEEIW